VGSYKGERMIAAEQLAKIKLIASDVDGVLTDGSVIYGSADIELKAFNIKDGLGMKLAGLCGLPMVLITGRSSDVVARRAAELNVKVVQGVTDKDAGLRAIATERRLQLEEIAYIGDDLNDLPALRLAGLPIAVGDAVAEVKELAAYITEACGGHGAVREAIEMILKGKGCWEESAEAYLKRVQSAGASHAPRPIV
jgi:3-deoxy-D-manno-octulosonate 8-phosphate phosphatase (KDO 8-P phosphatase)